MKIVCIKHVAFEGPGVIAEWAEKKGYEIKYINVYEGDAFISPSEMDLLLIMGGPMNIYEYESYSWLKEEKKYIKEVIGAGKKVLGICLGAQLISDVMGGSVTSGHKKEIGWFPIKKISDNKLLKGLNDMIVMHWHGDRFSIPEGTEHIYKSDACEQQGFVYDHRVIGLQFHFEMEHESIKSIVENCKSELVNDDYIQTAEQIINGADKYIVQNNKAMYNLLNNLEEA